jgi:hypothetical protein
LQTNHPAKSDSDPAHDPELERNPSLRECAYWVARGYPQIMTPADIKEPAHHDARYKKSHVKHPSHGFSIGAPMISRYPAPS